MRLRKRLSSTGGTLWRRLVTTIEKRRSSLHESGASCCDICRTKGARWSAKDRGIPGGATSPETGVPPCQDTGESTISWLARSVVTSASIQSDGTGRRRSRMGRAKAKPRTVETLRHEEASRRNIPTAEFRSVMEQSEQSPVQVAYERRNRDLDPQLVWRGKDARRRPAGLRLRAGGAHHAQVDRQQRRDRRHLGALAGDAGAVARRPERQARCRLGGVADTARGVRGLAGGGGRDVSTVVGGAHRPAAGDRRLHRGPGRLRVPVIARGLGD